MTWALITCINEELDATLHESEEEAQAAFMEYMKEAYSVYYQEAADDLADGTPEEDLNEPTNTTKAASVIGWARTSSGTPGASSASWKTDFSLIPNEKSLPGCREVS